MTGPSGTGPSAVVASPTGTSITPSGDTYLNIDAVNHASDPTVNLYTWPEGKIANAILMKFDLASIPVGSTISSATLNLYLIDSDPTADGTYTVTVHKIINKNPDLARATGYTADGANGWTPNACCYDSIPIAQADIGPAVDTRSVDKTAGFKQWNVTSIAQGWLSNPSTNFGLLVNADPSKLRDRWRFFASREHPTVGQRPYLTVVYTAPPPGTVTDLVVSVVGSNSATLTFTEVDDGTGQPANYNVRYAVAPMGWGWGSATDVTQGTCSVPMAGTQIGARRTCTVLGLASSTTYDFQLVAFRGTLNQDAVFGDLSNIAGATTAPTYTTVDLGTLGGQSSTALDVNDRGQIVGWSLTAAGETHAFLYADGVMRDLGTLGGTASAADHINEAGQVVGRITTAGGESRVVLWTDGTALDLGPGPVIFGGGGGPVLNERGQVAWSSPIADGGSQAVLWTNGMLQEFGSLGGTRAVVNAINDSGAIVGSSTLAPGGREEHAFVGRDGSLIDLGTLSDYGSDALDINTAGQIVGWSLDAQHRYHALLWEAGNMRDLGTLPGDVQARAIAINDLGWIAGDGSRSSVFYDVRHPFQWQPGAMVPLEPSYRTSTSEQYVAALNGHGLVVGRHVIRLRIDSATVWQGGAPWRLDGLGGESSRVNAINANGTVVGRAQTPSGAYHAVAWYRATPPSTAATASEGSSGPRGKALVKKGPPAATPARSAGGP